MIKAEELRCRETRRCYYTLPVKTKQGARSQGLQLRGVRVQGPVAQESPAGGKCRPASGFKLEANSLCFWNTKVMQ